MALRRMIAGAALLATLASGAAADVGTSLSRALEAARQGDWSQALGHARQTEPVAADIVIWQRLRAGQGTWPEYVTFLRRNGDWPGLKLMRKRAEAVMPSGLPARDVRAFFQAEAPQTGRGLLAYARALSGGQAQAALVAGWRSLDLAASEQQALLSAHGRTLAPHHEARLDTLLWDGRTDQARAMLPLVSPGWQALARARIALRRQASGVDGLIEAVPTALKSHPGLAYERFRWRIAKGRWDGAEEILRTTSRAQAGLGQPEAWANRRRGLARRALRSGRAQAAYALASQHGLREGSNYADLEWLSGYIALSKLRDPRRAISHFQRFERAVFTPISLGRAGYWMGRAQEAAGNAQNARAAFARAAQHQTSFYGQLAAQRAGIAPDPALAGGRLPDWRAQGFLRSSPMRAALALHLAGDTAQMLRFFLHAQETMTASQSAALAALGLEIKRPFVAVKIAKREAREGRIVPPAYFPVLDLPRTARVPPELALAVARQESELNPAAISPAGARGLMQLMPGTAQKMSRDLGIGYSRARLTSDLRYNAQLGTGYLDQMMARFDGNLILVAASYNAGPSRVDQWIAEYGDPRTSQVDAIEWIENIPFRETRNYVMRVLEGMHVYRTRLAGRAVPFQLRQAIGSG
ncbi:MAG: lytic transglycosylase domain-containing protein [Pseudomonadota bacterium]